MPARETAPALPPDSPAARLITQPSVFEFRQAVRVLEAMNPGAEPLGTGTSPAREAVRLCGVLRPVFPPSAVEAVEPGENGRPPMLRTLLFGLGGPDGPLPYAWQEWLLQQRRGKNRAPADFLDIFQHRLLSHLYRTLNKNHPALADARPHTSPIRGLLDALAGHPPGETSPIPATLAAFSINHRRPPQAFLAVLKSVLDVDGTIQPFRGRWRRLPAARQSHPGRSGANAVLGRNAVAGRHVWDQHAGLQLSLGPLDLRRYHAFQPDGEERPRLEALLEAYFGLDLEICIHPLLADGEREKPVLKAGHAPRLGRSWL